MVGGPAPNICLKARCGCLVHPQHKVMAVDVRSIKGVFQVTRVSYNCTASATHQPLVQHRVHIPRYQAKEFLDGVAQVVGFPLPLEPQPPPICVLLHQSIVGCQQRLHGLVEALVEPIGDFALANAASAGARL